jgi:hypothetical protein
MFQPSVKVTAPHHATYQKNANPHPVFAILDHGHHQVRFTGFWHVALLTRLLLCAQCCVRSIEVVPRVPIWRVVSIIFPFD